MPTPWLGDRVHHGLELGHDAGQIPDRRVIVRVEFREGEELTRRHDGDAVHQDVVTQPGIVGIDAHARHVDGGDLLLEAIELPVGLARQPADVVARDLLQGVLALGDQIGDHAGGGQQGAHECI